MTIQRIQLDNGLTLVSEQVHRAPVVSLQAWVHVGSGDETEKLAGVAHLHEHMLFKGTERRGVGEIARSIEAVGGEVNAWTSFDQTAYYVTLAAAELDTGLDVLADALQHSLFDADELAREKEVVLEEIARAQDDPGVRVSHALFGLAYQKHPYRRPVLGWEKTVRAMTRDQIVGFYRRYYRPQHVTVIAVGDFDTADLQQKVETHFGAWQPPALPEKEDRRLEPTQKKPRLQVMSEPVKETRLALAWHIVPLGHPDAAALDALSLVLGGGSSSRLYERLRRQDGLVHQISAGAYTPREPGLFVVMASLQREHLESALSVLLETLDAMQTCVVSDEELEKVKMMLLSEAAYERETVQGQSRKIGFFQVVAGDFAAEEQYHRAILQLQPEDLQRVAAQYLNRAVSMIVQIPEDATAVDEAALLEALKRPVAAALDKKKVNAKSDKRGIQRICLPQGPIVLLLPEQNSVMSMRAIMPGGQRVETAKNQGVGSLWSSIFGKATEGFSQQEMAAELARLGGGISAFSGRYSLGLRGDFVADKAMDGFALLGQTLFNSTFSVEEFERERDILLQYVRNREDNPARLAFEEFAAALYPDQPYGLRMVGTEESLLNCTHKDIVTHVQTHWSPENMVLAVVGGGFDSQQLLGRIETYLEEAAARPTDVATAPMELLAQTPQNCKIRYDLDKAQSHIVVGTLGTTHDDSDRFPLEVLSAILSGQSGRLFMDLRDARSLAYTVMCTNVEGVEPGYIAAYIATHPDKEVEALAGLYKHFEAIQQHPVENEELQRAKRYLVGSYVIDLQRCGTRAMLMAVAEQLGLGYDDPFSYIKKIEAVTVKDVQRVAQRFLGTSDWVEMVVGPSRSVHTPT